MHHARYQSSLTRASPLVAIRILLQITRQIRRLDISHNLIGPPGARSLLNGLATLRLRYSSKEYGIWGLSEVNLGCNALDDGAMDALMGYAKKDVCLRKVLVQANDIEVGPGRIGSRCVRV